MKGSTVGESFEPACLTGRKLTFEPATLQVGRKGLLLKEKQKVKGSTVGGRFEPACLTGRKLTFEP